MNYQQDLKSNILRFGTCIKCGKSFLTQEEKKEDYNTIFETMKNFWKPKLCDRCKNDTKTKNT
jgi:hypothetical protein